ncbi:hypothetical protein MAE02_59190 [Microvirga aerophila]|uniref:Uncharacterized protein n=1 Tax=Microvirga aerophila TaxID=670291 RepID=A0A512C202_9HYPH|nr:hypothetical protein MAE02_59190 [Microvirga aerophila]
MEQRRKLGAKSNHTGFQVMIEHGADHGHATLRPLAHPAKLRMGELRHGAMTRRECAKQGQNSARADAVPLGDVGYDLLPFRGEV